LIGALVAAILFETMNRTFGYYISHFPSYKLVYGAFATVPIFLMWIYLSWLTILLGAVIAASLSHWRTPAARQLASTTQLLDALRVLKAMTESFKLGKVNTFPEMSKSLRIGYDKLEKILERLAGASIVRKAEGQGWLLVRDANNISTSEIVRLFLLDNTPLLAEQSEEPLQKWFISWVKELDKSTNITLQKLFSRS